jgi:hypothetical protein
MHHPRQVFNSMITGMALSALFCVPGCRGKSPIQEQASLRQLAVQYGQYAAKHEGMGPSGPQEFKEFIKENRPLSEQDIEKMFVSNRDHEPYVVFYKMLLTTPDANGGPALAHEKIGVEGKRLVALVTTRVEEADEDRLAELVPKTP